MEPTNADLLLEIQKQGALFKAHAHEDADVFEKQAVINHEMTSSLASLHEWKATVATKDDVREIFNESLKNFFKVTGLNTKTFIVTTAMVVGAIVVIFGGLKSVLAWIGFEMVGK